MLPALMLNFRKDIWRLALALGFVLAIAWAPYLFFGKTLLASASDSASLYPTGAQPTLDGGMRVLKSLDPGAPAWQNEPWLAVQHRLLFDEHVMPQWNPYDAYGAPFAASMLPEPFYPLTFAVAIDPTPWTYNLLVVGRIFILALGCAVFVRVFTGFVPALVAGICAAFSGYFLVYLDIVHIGVEVMLPWILLGVELVMRRAGPRTAALLAAAWGMSLLGGMPESSALATLVIGMYAVLRVVHDRRDRLTVKRLVWFASGIGVGTAVAAVMIVPFLEYLSRDYDQHQLHPPGFGFDKFQFPELLTEFAPLALGPPGNSILSAFHGFSGFRGGPGVFAIFFSLIAGATAIGAFTRRTLADRVGLFLVLAGIAFESKRFGVPLVQWIGALPLVRLSNFQKYGEADIAVCIACAAGFGVAAVIERRVGFWQLMSALMVTLGTITWLYYGVVLPAGTKHTLFFYGAFGLMLGVFALCVLTVAAANTIKRIVTIESALVGIALFESAFAFFVPITYLIDKPASASRNPYSGAPYIKYLQRETSRDDNRIVATGNLLFPDWAGAFGLYDTRALAAMYPERYLTFIDAFVARERPAFEDQFDRFTGSRPIDFNSPLVRRWLTLSSVGYIVTSTPVPSDAGPHAFLPALWKQNVDAITAPRSSATRLTTAAIGGVSENVLFDHPPDNTIAYRTNVPASFPFIAVDVALDPAVWSTPCGGAVSFALDAINARGTPIANAIRTIDPKHVAGDRRWNRMTLDLRSAKGQPVTLRFATSVPPPGDLCAAWALWGEPRWTPVLDLHNYEPTKHAGFSLVSGVTDANIYHVDNPLPRLALFHQLQVVPSGKVALQTITAPPFDPTQTVVVEGSLPVHSGSAKNDHVEIVNRRSNRVEATVTTSTAAILLQNDTWYPGWHATVDGNETPILRADYLFRAIAIPAGRHQVIIEYRSSTALGGIVLSIAGLVALLVMFSLTPTVRSSLSKVYSTRRARA